MKVLGLVGPSDAGKTTVVEGLVERLADRGSVGTLKRLTHPPDVDTEGRDTARHRAAGAAATYGVTDDGGWFATGERLSLGAALDRLAAEHDYAVVEGYRDSTLPKVVLGDGWDHRGEALASAEGPSDLDLDAVVERLEATEPYETLESLVRRVKRSPAAERAGAIATFTGRVRAVDGPDDDRTTALEFEKYEGVAEQRLGSLAEELEAREGIHAVELHHRTGLLEYGEDIVFVVVLAGHREEAFRTVEDGINRLKAEVPIFKKEVTVADEFWVHDRPG